MEFSKNSNIVDMAKYIYNAYKRGKNPLPKFRRLGLNVNFMYAPGCSDIFLMNDIEGIKEMEDGYLNKCLNGIVVVLDNSINDINVTVFDTRVQGIDFIPYVTVYSDRILKNLH